MTIFDDERRWITLRIVCPHCGRAYYRQVLASCNLCEVFARPRSRTCWPYVWLTTIVFLTGMAAAWSCQFFTD